MSPNTTPMLPRVRAQKPGELVASCPAVDVALAVMSLENAERRFNVLSRAEYEVTPNVTVFAQASYAQSKYWSNNTINVFPGNTGTSGALGGPPLIKICRSLQEP